MNSLYRLSLGCVALCGLLLAWPASAGDQATTAAPAPRTMTIDRLYSLPWVTGTAPTDPAWSPDSRRLAFLWNDEGGNFMDVWVADAANGKPVRVTRMPRPDSPADPGSDIAKLEQVERAENDHGVSQVIWAPDGRHLVFNLHGRLYRVLPGQPAQPISEAGSAAADPAASARAKAVAYLASGSLWMVELGTDTPQPRQVYAAGGSRVGVESFAWSHDGKQLAVIEADNSKVPMRGIPDYLGAETRLVEVERPYPGEPSPSRRLGVVAASGGAVRWMDLGPDPLDQIFSVRWSPDDSRLLTDKSDLYVKDRRLLLLDPANGKSQLLVRERDPHNVSAEWWADWAPDGYGVYFTSDRGNDYHVYYQALAGGAPKAITAGDWAVFSASISPAARALFVVSNAGNTESRRVYRVPLGGGAAQPVTPAEGAHHPTMSPDGKLLADLYSNDVTPPDLYLQAATGTAAKAKDRRQVTHSPLPEFSAYHWVAPKYVRFNNVNDGTPLHARLTLPPDFDPAKKYPAILGSVYSNTVHNEWGGRVYHPTWGLDQLLAQRGFVVINVDISGSSGHGKAFRQRIREDYGGVDVDDLYSATRWLVAQGYVDPSRIGIWGSSYGGLLTAMSMFRYPDVYRAGVAAAPATSLFHALTGEMQVMMMPQGHEAQYAKSSAFMHSGGLKGHLMLLHGMRDEVVLFKDSVTLTQRLILQGGNVDLVPLPNAPHSWDTQGMAQTRYGYHRLVDYFERYLRAPQPPASSPAQD
ncbi:MAG: S9 family peptidase [Xanthomonadales bacterium]|nr:S9 family peptidase [Xanthomonadales bacterium]